jgi:translocation and assembly module TamA
MMPSAIQADEVMIKVQLDGAPEGKIEILLSGLSIEQQKESKRLSLRRIKRLHEQASDELKKMLNVYGYYNVHVTSDLKQRDNTWQAHYQLELGQQVTIKTLTISIEGQAKEDGAFQSLLTDFPLQKGDVFNHVNYESAKKTLLRLAAERGYFDGEFVANKVEVNSDKNIAIILLKYHSGQRYVFAPLDYPKTVINKQLLSKLSPMKAGEPYLAAKVLKLRNNLTNSGYFKSVAVTTLFDDRQDGQVSLAIILDHELKHRYTAGLGFGTDSGARMSVGWENRYINNRGHRLSAQAKLSQVSQSVAMDYKMPFWSDKISDIGFNSEFKQEDTDSSESQSHAIGSYYKTKRWGWNEIGSLKFLNEQFDVSQDDNTSLLLIPSIAWSRTWADNTIYTKQGGQVSLSLSGASESVLSDTTFAQLVLRGKYIYSLNENGRLITRATLGTTEVSDFNYLPSSLRFFAGGDSSIRGFDYESLGPKGNDGQVEGGRYLAVGSIEYEHLFWNNWGGAIFSDFGNALNSWSDPLEYSLGVGIRWRSPIGLIRVDLAKGISESDEPIRFHVVIGPDL